MTSSALQDLILQMLQQNPQMRISLEGFFKHSFLVNWTNENNLKPISSKRTKRRTKNYCDSSEENSEADSINGKKKILKFIIKLYLLKYLDSTS